MYSACGPFNKSKEIILKFKETRDSRYFYQNKQDKPYLQLDMAYGDFKDLARRAVSDKALQEKVFSFVKIKKMVDINVNPLQSPIKFFIKSLLVHTKEQELSLM